MKIKVLLLFLPLAGLFGQSLNMSLDPMQRHLVSRYQIVHNNYGSLHSTFSGIDAKGWQAYQKEHAIKEDFLLNEYHLGVDSVQGESNKPFLKQFYKKKASALYAKHDDFEIEASPIVLEGREF